MVFLKRQEGRFQGDLDHGNGLAGGCRCSVALRGRAVEAGSVLPRMVFALVLLLVIVLFTHRVLEPEDFTHASDEQADTLESADRPTVVSPESESVAGVEAEMPPQTEVVKVEEAPQEVVEATPTPLPEAVPVEEAVAVATPEEEKIGEPPHQPLRFSQVYEDRRLWPHRVQLTQPIEVPLHLQGKRVGEAKLVAGTVLPVVRLRPDGQVVVRHLQEEVTLPEERTNLLPIADAMAIALKKREALLAKAQQGMAGTASEGTPGEAATTEAPALPGLEEEAQGKTEEPPLASFKKNEPAKEESSGSLANEGSDAKEPPVEEAKPKTASRESEPPKPTGTPEIAEVHYRQLKPDIRARRDRTLAEWENSSDVVRVRLVFKNDHSNIAFENHRVELYVLAQNMRDNSVTQLIGKETFTLTVAPRNRAEMEAASVRTEFKDGPERSGFSYRGWLVRIYDEAGHLVLERASTPAIASHAPKIAKLKVKRILKFD